MLPKVVYTLFLAVKVFGSAETPFPEHVSAEERLMQELEQSLHEQSLVQFRSVTSSIRARNTREMRELLSTVRLNFERKLAVVSQLVEDLIESSRPELGEIDWSAAEKLHEILTKRSVELPSGESNPIPHVVHLKNQEVRFGPGGGSYEPYGIFRVRAISEAEFHTMEKTKHVDSVLASRGIPTVTVLPDGEEGLDWFVFEEKRIGLCTDYGVVKQFNVGQSVPRAAEIAVNALELLQKYHRLGMVHGGQFIFDLFASYDDRNDRGVTSKGVRYIVLSEFDSMALRNTGSSVMYTDPFTRSHLEPSVECRSLIIDHEIFRRMSPGELQGFCPTRADDMYRLAEALFKLLGGRINHTEQRDAADWIETKQRLRLSGTSQAQLDIFNAFKQAMFELSNTRNTAEPNYAHWVQAFRALIK